MDLDCYTFKENKQLGRSGSNGNGVRWLYEMAVKVPFNDHIKS